MTSPRRPACKRVHVLAWRDLEDDEAGGSEVHIDEVAKLWAAAGVEVTMRTAAAQGQPAETTRDSYRVIRRAGRYMVFPRAAVAESPAAPAPATCSSKSGTACPSSPPVEPGAGRDLPAPRPRRDVDHDARRPARPPGVAAREPDRAPFYRRRPIATLSESSKQELVDDLGFSPDRVTVVHPGIDPRYTVAPDVAKAPEPLVMAVGRLVPVKRYDRLIRACHHARARCRACQLHIVGEGYERPAIEALVAELDAGGWVTLRGSVSEDDKIDLFRRAWLVASASAREGWGMTLTEAAACGTPAVASRIAGHADSIREGSSGLLTDHDPAALGDGIADVLSDAELRARLRAGALAWAGELTWSATATQLMRLVADEVSRRRSPR